jgi:hypothetical protein
MPKKYHSGTAVHPVWQSGACIQFFVPGTACDHCTVWQQQQHPQRPPLRVLRRLPQRQRRPLPVALPPPKPTPPVAVQTRRQSSRSTKGQRLLPTQHRGSGLAPPHHQLAKKSEASSYLKDTLSEPDIRRKGSCQPGNQGQTKEPDRWRKGS